MNSKAKPAIADFKFPFSTALALAMIGTSALAQTAAPRIKDVAMVPRLTIESTVGTINVIEYADELITNRWQVLTNIVVTNSPYLFADLSAPPSPQRFYRVGVSNASLETNVTAGMVQIPAGWFIMGDLLEDTVGEISYHELPPHIVQVSGFYMDANLVTKTLWDDVFLWATNHGFTFSGGTAASKAANHPVYSVDWYEAIKWCNARSQKAGLTAVYYRDAAMTQVYKSDYSVPYANWSASGYRLPTEAEWEKAARGGLTGKRFPWGDTITHEQANYRSDGVYIYDISSTSGYHPDYDNDPQPYTNPVGSFAANGYGLHDMAGNVWQWCWDLNGSYSTDLQSDPRGPSSGSVRVLRGGCWTFNALSCRVTFRLAGTPGGTINNNNVGFRTVLPAYR